LQSTSTDAGIITDVKPLLRNAYSSIRRNFEDDSNATNVSDLQSEKQSLQSTSTDAGIIIAVKLLPRNADSSIRCNFESLSNVTDVSDSQLEKQGLVNREIDDEIHARADSGGQRKSSVKISITPLSTVSLRGNAVRIFVALRCEADVSL
jgi:hypothetical protein